MKILDDRLAKKQNFTVAIVAKKVRKEGVPSNTKAPLDAQNWAVKTEGMFCNGI